jgi:hypothetical protein
MCLYSKLCIHPSKIIFLTHGARTYNLFLTTNLIKLRILK